MSIGIILCEEAILIDKNRIPLAEDPIKVVCLSFYLSLQSTIVGAGIVLYLV